MKHTFLWVALVISLPACSVFSDGIENAKMVHEITEYGIETVTREATAIQAVAGDEVRVERTFNVRMGNGLFWFNYARPEQEWIDILQENMTLSTPEDVQIINSNVDIFVGDITYTMVADDGLDEYEIEGIRIDIVADLIISEQAGIGRKNIFLSVPNLPQLAEMTNSKPDIGADNNNKLLQEHGFNVALIRVHESEVTAAAGNAIVQLIKSTWWLLLLVAPIVIGAAGALGKN